MAHKRQSLIHSDVPDVVFALPSAASVPSLNIIAIARLTNTLARAVVFANTSALQTLYH